MTIAVTLIARRSDTGIGFLSTQSDLLRTRFSNLDSQSENVDRIIRGGTDLPK